MQQSFEERIKQLVKAKLNPDTENLIDRKATADAEYYGGETTDFDKFRDVEDPFARRRLVDQENQMSMRSSQSLGGALQNREVGISDMVGNFAKARQEEAAAEQEDFQRKMSEREFQLKESEAQSNAAYRNSSLALDKAKGEQGDPIQEMVSSLVAQGIPQDKARQIAISSTFADNTTVNDYYNPKPKAQEAGTTDYTPYIGGAAAGVGASLLGAPLLLAGGAAAGGYYGTKALAPTASSLWAKLKSQF